MPSSECTCTAAVVWCAEGVMCRGCDVQRVWCACGTRTVVSATRITLVSENLPLRHGCSKQQSEWQVIYCVGVEFWHDGVLLSGDAFQKLLYQWHRRTCMLHASPSAAIPAWRYTAPYEPSSPRSIPCTYVVIDSTASTAAAVCLLPALHLGWHPYSAWQMM